MRISDWSSDVCSSDLMTNTSSEQAYATVRQAIEWLSAHYQDQPSLAVAAAEVGLSESHFQRVFTDWAGISPKKFVQYLTLAHAKERLAASVSVLDAAYDAGRSEEHTSELQSLMRISYAVFCLKKKKINNTHHNLSPMQTTNNTTPILTR